MVSRIICAPTGDRRLYELIDGAWQLSPIDPNYSGGLAPGLWGGPNRTLWAHRYYNASGAKFVFYDGSIWTETIWGTGNDDSAPRCMHGSDDGTRVYAISGYVTWRYTGVGALWELVSTKGGYAVWCNSTGQHVMVAAGSRFMYSDDYGATWSDLYSQCQTQIGTVPGFTRSVWGVSSGTDCSFYLGTQVYQWFGRILRYDTSTGTWSIHINTDAAFSYYAPGIWTTDGSIFTALAATSTGARGYRVSGSSQTETLVFPVGTSTQSSLDGRRLIGTSNEIVCGTHPVATLDMYSYRSIDGGQSWVPITDTVGRIYNFAVYGWIPNAQPLDWYFETGNPPFIESRTPSSDSNGIEFDTSITFDVVDAESYVRTDMIDAYVNDALAFSGPNTFISPYNGPGSSITFISNGSIDGYDAYRVVLDKTTEYDFNSINSVRCTALDYGYNEIDETWYFHTGSLFFDNQDPYNEVRVSFSNKQMKLDVISAQAAASSYIDAYVDGVLAFSNEIFYSPFDGPDAYFGTVNIDGYDGYRIILDNSNDWSSYQTIIIDAYAEDAYGFVVSETWSFRIQDIYSPKYKVSSVFPQSNAVNVNPNTNIKIDIYDEDSGIDPTTIDAYLNEVRIYNGATDSFISGYDGSVVEVDVDGYDGYRAIIDKIDPYNSGQRIAVKIYARDNEGN